MNEHTNATTTFCDAVAPPPPYYNYLMSCFTFLFYVYLQCVVYVRNVRLLYYHNTGP